MKVSDLRVGMTITPDGKDKPYVITTIYRPGRGMYSVVTDRDVVFLFGGRESVETP